MIESALFFALGFLCAGFLALMVAPAIWRRAVLLTRRRIEASVPLTLNEITAEKDRIRAEAAMSLRRLEMSVSDLKARNAEQSVDLARGREELRHLAAEREERSAAISKLEAEGADLRARLNEREEELRQSALQLGEAKRAIDERNAELTRLNGLYEEASFTASGRQIELVAREAEAERLSDDVSQMRSAQRELESRLNKAESEHKSTMKALEFEKRRSADLERKIERMLATLADREEALQRQDQELSRLHEAASTDAPDSGEPDGDAPARRSRLEARLATLMRENKKLRGRVSELEQAPAGQGEPGAQDARLREQISDLAAQVINMTILLEGKNSAPARAISQAGGQSTAGGATTLADRVRALQQAAARSTTSP